MAANTTQTWQYLLWSASKSGCPEATKSAKSKLRGAHYKLFKQVVDLQAQEKAVVALIVDWWKKLGPMEEELKGGEPNAGGLAADCARRGYQCA